MKNRFIPALLALAIALLACSCSQEQASEYKMRPEDKVLFYETSDGYSVTSTDASAGGDGAAAAPVVVNKTALALSDGSSYYLDGGKIVYKSYYSDPYTIESDVEVEQIFYMMGTYFAWDGGTLYVITSENKLQAAMSNAGADASFIESGTNLYASAADGFYRLPYASNPELVTKCDGYPTIITEDGDGVYYYAVGKIYYLKHLDVFPKEIVKSGITRVLATTGTSDATVAACLTDSGTIAAVNLTNGAVVDTGIMYGGGDDVEIRLWPELSPNPKALTVGNACYIFDGAKLLNLPGGNCVHFDGRYFYLAGSGSFTVFDIEKPDQATSTSDLFPDGDPQVIATPNIAYLVSGVSEDSTGYTASVYALRDGRAELLTSFAYAGSMPCVGYGYYGLYYVTDKGLFVYDNSSDKSETLMETSEPLTAVSTRMGGVYALYASGRLDLLKQGEEVSIPVATEGVKSLADTGYDAAELRSFPMK